MNETPKPEEVDSQDVPECDEDEAWWGEVVSTAENIECLSQRSSQRSLFSNQVDTQPDQTACFEIQHNPTSFSRCAVNLCLQMAALGFKYILLCHVWVRQHQS